MCVIIIHCQGLPFKTLVWRYGWNAISIVPHQRCACIDMGSGFPYALFGGGGRPGVGLLRKTEPIRFAQLRALLFATDGRKADVSPIHAGGALDCRVSSSFWGGPRLRFGGGPASRKSGARPVRAGRYRNRIGETSNERCVLQKCVHIAKCYSSKWLRIVCVRVV